MAAVSPLGRASGVEPRAAPADALTGLYERHADRVFQYCLNWLRSREEAEDAAQTTFLYAYRGLDRGVVPTHERGWLLSIARNVCLSRTDATRRRAVEVAQDPHALEEIIAAPAPSNELDGLTDALATLTESQRHAILLREWHGLSYGEIAERLELSQAAVETLLFRARRSLARRLRQPVGIGSFLPWLRSLGEGGAAKVALGAAAVAVTATTGAVTITNQQKPRPVVWESAVRSARALQAIPVARRVKAGAPAKHPAAAANVPTATTPVTTSHTERQPQEPAPTPTQPRADTPRSSATATMPPPEPAASAQTVTDPTTTATATVAAPVIGTVTSAVSSAVGNTADTVVNTATNVVATAQAAIAAVTSVVPTIVGPKLP
jgi:RNA polymerase sigma-70 factor (ECF subfamily)